MKDIGKFKALENDFRQYAYVVSHDVGASVRHIKEFTRLLVSSLDVTLNEEQEQYRYFINRAMDKLDLMQDALLAISRLQRYDLNIGTIDVKDFLTEITTQEKYQNVDLLDMSFNVDEQLIKADAGMLAFAVNVILDNAVKFHAPDNQRIVELKGTATKDKYVISVIDNDIGIANEYRDKVFDLFRTLNSEKEYEGVGSGLTMAKSIIDKHNGIIDITMTDDEKTCFSIILPIV